MVQVVTCMYMVASEQCKQSPCSPLQTAASFVVVCRCRIRPSLRSLWHLQVLLVSAQHALLSRLVLQGNGDKDIALRFGRLAFGSRARSFPPHEYRAAAEEMLADSGLAELEQTVLAFLYAHSGSLKLLALLDDIVRMLQQVRFHSVFSVCQCCIWSGPTIT